MNARNLTALTLAALMMSGVACSKRDNKPQSITPASQEPAKVEDKKVSDCSDLNGLWELDEALAEAAGTSEIRFDVKDDGSLDLSFSNEGVRGTFKLNGEEQVQELDGQKVTTKGTCTNNGMLVVEFTVAGQKGRWIFVQTSKLEAQMTVQELNAFADGKKGEETYKGVVDVATGKILPIKYVMDGKKGEETLQKVSR